MIFMIFDKCRPNFEFYVCDKISTQDLFAEMCSESYQYSPENSVKLKCCRKLQKCPKSKMAAKKQVLNHLEQNIV